MKRIIVACGSGVATSQTVASKVESILEEKGVSVQVEAVDIKSLEAELKTADIYISITKGSNEDVNLEKYDIPILDGIPFLTGIKQKQETEKLLEILKK